MLIRNIKEFLEKTKTRKILALDMGKKKIGLAISDPNHKIVNPLEVLKNAPESKSGFFVVPKVVE